jgi:hypothetical protein
MTTQYYHSHTSTSYQTYVAGLRYRKLPRFVRAIMQSAAEAGVLFAIVFTFSCLALWLTK